MKVVINTCYGGFSLTQQVYDELGLEWAKGDVGYAPRANPRLIAAIEKIGVEAASGECAELKIVDIPDDIQWEIEEYDGMESIHEAHRIWR